MNTQKLKLTTALFLCLLFIPQTSDAYFTTAQSATKLNDTTVLYTVTYRFGFNSRELYMPIIAKRGMTDGDPSELIAGYKILNDDEPTDFGTSNGMVLTGSKDIEIRDNRYYLPAGKSAEFTLITLLTLPADTAKDDLDLSLLVSRLPFTMIDKGVDIPAHLNPSELKYYHTPSVQW